MLHSCPECCSPQVDRCIPELRRAWVLRLYHCRDCQATFWSMRRGTRIRLALLCTMFALVAVYGWALYNGISGDPASAGAAEFPARGADDYLAAMRTLDRDGESRPDPGAIALL